MHKQHLLSKPLRKQFLQVITQNQLVTPFYPFQLKVPHCDILIGLSKSILEERKGANWLRGKTVIEAQRGSNREMERVERFGSMIVARKVVRKAMGCGALMLGRLPAPQMPGVSN